MERSSAQHHLCVITLSLQAASQNSSVLSVIYLFDINRHIHEVLEIMLIVS